MSIKPVWTQFNGGEISPWMEGRIDFPKYGYSAKLMLNYIPMSEGSFKRRGGSHYVASCKEVDAVVFEIIPYPEEAMVVINGEEQRRIYCAIGDHVNYTVTAGGYQSQSGALTIEKETSLNIGLVSTTRRYSLTINPTPEDAEVYINNIKRRTAELLFNSQPTWSVSKDGYGYKSGTEIIKDNIVLPVVLEMTFTIVANPSDATIIMNGIERRSMVVNPGDIVTWEVSRNGFTPEKGQTTVEKTMTQVVNLAVVNPNKVILDTGVPGNYSITVDEPRVFGIEGTSGGSGGYWKTDWNGGSGAVYKGVVVLAAGTYQIKIGDKGYSGTPPSNGGATVISLSGIDILNLGGGIFGGKEGGKVKVSFYKEMSNEISQNGTSPGKGNPNLNPNILYGTAYGFGGGRNGSGGTGYLKIVDNGLYVESD